MENLYIEDSEKVTSVNNSHKPIVQRYLYRRKMEQNPYYHKLVDSLGISDDDAEMIMFGCSEEDINVPFSKLYSDLKKDGFIF